MPRTERYTQHTGGVEGARPYSVGGNLPANAVATTYSVHGKGRKYHSDAPFVQPYNERPVCQGVRSDGKACKAKAEPAKDHCSNHSAE